MIYNKRLKELRERYGIPQKELANLINVKRPVYTQYENENVTLPLIHLITICDYFNVSLDYIFNFTEIKNYPESKKEINKLEAGQNLKTFRKENKITQNQLANILNTTHSVISDYERGRYLINTSFLYAICLKYTISADYLIGRTKNISPEK